MPALLLLPLLSQPSWVLNYRNTGRNTGLVGYPDEGGKKVWTSPASFNLSEIILFWGLGITPNNLTTSDALARGITWALSPDFCSRLLDAGKFPEESLNDVGLGGISFLTCDDLREAVASALNTWAINNQQLHFEDATEMCAQEEGAVIDDRCKYAEVFIVVSDESGSEEDLAAYVENDPYSVDFTPTTTAGRVQDPGRGLRRSKMTISREICWYMDTTFCYNFHRMSSDGWDVMLMVRLIFGVIFILCALLILFTLARVCGSWLCPKRKDPRLSRPGDVEEKHACGGERCDSLLTYLAAMNTGCLLFALFWCVFIPIFYFKVFLPCWECYDFQATIAHEIGHVLGFHHPDQRPEQNLKALEPMGTETCWWPLQHVELKPLPEGADSIMFSVTKHRDRTCLTADDLEGLNFLYPTCDPYVPSEPQCIETRKLSGWLRLAVTAGIPYLLATVLLLLLQCCVRPPVHKKSTLSGTQMLC